MSAATADRLLQAHRYAHPHGLSTTRAGPLLKQQIPIRTFAQWDEAKPGFLEVDLVAHCGGRLQGGGCLYTITLTDVATGWTECFPLLNRGREAVLAALQRARALFPFPILGIDTDNGGEFIDEEVAAYCVRERITFTRGRPYEKRDQQRPFRRAVGAHSHLGASEPDAEQRRHSSGTPVSVSWALSGLTSTHAPTGSSQDPDAGAPDA